MIQGSKPRLLGGVALVAIALIAVSGVRGGSAQTAGSTVQEKLDQLAKMRGAERQRFLEEQAIKEGKVVWYSSNDPRLVRGWNDAFRKRYPQIDAQFVRMTASATIQRALSESQAGRPVTDLLDPPPTNLAILQKNGVPVRYVSPESQGFDPDARDPRGFWTAYWYAPLVVAFNTGLVKRAEVPVTLEAAADPALRGKLGFVSVAGPHWVAGVLKAKGEAAGMEAIRKIAAQEPRLYESHTALGNALASGQVPIAFELLIGVADRNKKAGAPVDWLAPEPFLVEPIYLVIPRDAPHPFAAALVYDWLLSREGQALYKETGYLGPRKDTEYAPSAADIMKVARTEKRTVVDLSTDVLANVDRDIKIFEDLFVRK